MQAGEAEEAVVGPCPESAAAGEHRQRAWEGEAAGALLDSLQAWEVAEVGGLPVVLHSHRQMVQRLEVG
jgi:hypothetical protein